MHYLIESGALTEVDGRWMAAPGLEMAGLPDGVRSLIGARLDALPAREHEVLQHAAVMDRRFWRDAVAHLSGGPVDDALDRLVARGLVDRFDDRDGYGDLVFRHVLTRDVAYASLPIGERAERHARLAGWLRDRFPDVISGPAVGLLAHHYERAVVLSRELDHTDPGLAGAAFTALVRAGRDAANHDLLRDADHWFSRARDLGSFDRSLGLEVSQEHGVVLLGLRRLDDAGAVFTEVQRRATPDHPELAARATAYLGSVARLAGYTDIARERFEEAHGRWRALDDPGGEVDTLRLQGWSELTAGRARAALPLLLRALALEERLGDDRLGGDLLKNLGWCELLAGEVSAGARPSLGGGIPPGRRWGVRRGRLVLRDPRVQPSARRSGGAGVGGGAGPSRHDEGAGRSMDGVELRHAGGRLPSVAGGCRRSGRAGRVRSPDVRRAGRRLGEGHGPTGPGHGRSGHRRPRRRPAVRCSMAWPPPRM